MSFKSFALTPISAALLSIAFANSAVAADEKVESVIVSATRSETASVPTAAQITVVDAEQIRVSGATTITEILRTQAGIQIQDLDGSGGRNVTVAMRGFSATAANNTLVLVDGRKLNNPSLAGPALNSIALKDIERIEIIQGSAGVLFGDQAEGGVINVITRHAKDGEFNGTVSAERGSGDLENYTASLNQGFSNGLNYSLSAQKRNADNFRDNNQSAATNVLGNIGFKFDSGNVFVEQQAVRDDLRLPGSLSNAVAKVDPRHTNTPNDFSNQDTDTTRVGGEFKFTKEWALLGEYSDRDETGDYLYGTYGVSYEMQVKSFTPRVVGNIATANGTSVITVGYDKVDSDYATADKFTDFNQKISGIYAQAVYPLTKKFTLTAGTRHSSVDDVNHVFKADHSDSLNSSEIGVNYQIDSEWRAFARLADGFRFANADENAYVLPDVKFLKAQTSKSQEAGLAWQNNTANVTYSIYHMAIENEIAFDSINYVNINLPDSERQGFMFDGNVKLSEQIALHGNYTYTDAELVADTFKGKSIPYVAENTANVGVIFNFVKNVSASFDANYTGSRVPIGDNANAAQKIPALTLFNFNILWDINNLELGFRVKNITNEKYADYQSAYSQFPQPGRIYNAHISYSF